MNKKCKCGKKADWKAIKDTKIEQYLCDKCLTQSKDSHILIDKYKYIGDKNNENRKRN